MQTLVPFDIKSPKTSCSFLSGGGEMGDRTRNYNWSETPIGDPDQWPQSLRTIVSIILNSKFPMFLWWGDELIQFYNDAYRPSLGNNGKHPTALGQRAGDCWPEIWPIIKPLIDQVRFSGEATWSEDELIPIYRNGTLEDVYWTFGYSPVHDEAGNVGGVLVVCTETTEKVAGLQKLKESENLFHSLIEAVTIPMCLYIGRELKIKLVNEALLHTWGRDRSVVGKTLKEAIPELEGQPFLQLLDDVFTSGKPYSLKDAETKVVRAGVLTTSYFDLWYKPMFNEANEVYGILATGID
ncbi:MAG: PAS domain-containing protein, partial [Bacteroidota bacterium]|nr:PAS domain-containing protein [Bacteroidota bacterium]